jgi:hypothetical protein
MSRPAAEHVEQPAADQVLADGIIGGQVIRVGSTTAELAQFRAEELRGDLGMQCQFVLQRQDTVTI